MFVYTRTEIIKDVKGTEATCEVINMFKQHYLGKKKPTFLVCNPKHGYGAILEFSKNNDLFNTKEHIKSVICGATVFL